MGETLCVVQKLDRSWPEVDRRWLSWLISATLVTIDGSDDPKSIPTTLEPLTINDVLISLERFGEAKDEGLLASHLRGLPLADSPTQAKCVSVRAEKC